MDRQVKMPTGINAQTPRVHTASQRWRPTASVGDACFYITATGVRVEAVILSIIDKRVLVQPRSDQRETAKVWRAINTVFVEPKA